MIWITRGSKPKLNRDTGQSATGNYESRVEGPDAVSNSALKFNGLDNLEIPMNKNLSEDFTIQFGFKE